MHPPSPRTASAKAGGGGDGAGEWSVAEPGGLLAGQKAEWPRPPFPRENLGRDFGLRVQGPSELIVRGLGTENNQ